MNTDTTPKPKIHHGRNVKRLRDILGIKQEYLAFELNLSQQTISNLEAKETIDDETLSKVAEVLKVPVNAIKNMDEEATINYINTFNDSAINHGHFSPYYCTFNPIDKVVELYERLLEVEREKNK
ncbi:MAG: helix-turn-helix domain-containing protein [Bacteroidales bacterium]|jgi:transcriptional regulator with XRE-family HTH domain|nr:helix-turn-helix domain-containing protein [Bacteroidales bacterium]